GRSARGARPRSPRESHSARLAFEALDDRTVPGFLAPVTSAYKFGAVGDFNKDGSADLVALDSTVGGTGVLLGNGDGTFQAPIPLPVTPLTKVGDVNADGRLDILTRSPSYTSIDVFLGNGDGTFHSAASINFAKPRLYGRSVTSFDLGDLNNDGRLDLAATWSYLTGSNTHKAYLSVRMGRGDGSFKSSNTTFLGELAGMWNVGPGLTALQDFNGDCNLDALVGSSLFLGQGNGKFDQPIPLQDPTVGYGPTVADVYGDGIADLMRVQVDLNTVSVT